MSLLIRIIATAWIVWASIVTIRVIELESTNQGCHHVLN